MAFHQNLNLKKLFWVTTAVLSALVLLYPVEGKDGWVLKFLVILTMPLMTISLLLVLAFLEILWEAFGPLFKGLKSWFYR